MLKPVATTCAKCEDPTSDMALTKCPICFKDVCEKCVRSKGGKEFCSQYCAEYFFHYEEED